MDDADFAAAVVAWLGSRTVACAESCTAGKLSQAFAAVGGAEEWFRGGLVAYQVPVKRSLLGVTEASVLNEAAAEEMAVGVASLLSADVTVSTSGLIGGESHNGVEPGTVFIATFVDGAVISRTHRFDGEPAVIVDAAVRQALCDLLRCRSTGRRRRVRGALRTRVKPSHRACASREPLYGESTSPASARQSGGASSKDQSGRLRAWRSS